MSFQLPVDKKVTAIIQAVDAYGNVVPAPSLPQPPAFVLSDPSLANLSAVIEPVGPVGLEKLTVSVGSLMGVADIELIAGAPQAFDISFGAPESR